MSGPSERIVLLTGASQGIGAVTARTLLEAGFRVILHHRGQPEDQAGAEAVVEGFAADRYALLGADFMANEAVEDLWKRALEVWGRIDTLVLNAATMVPVGGIDDSEDDWNHAWQTQLQVNVHAPSRLMRGAVRHFREQGGGVIITLSSWVAQQGVTNPSMLAYAASKGAIRATAQSIARGYARDNILSHIIAPGIVRTKMSEDFAALQGGEEKVTNSLAMGEWVPPSEVAELITYLATGKAKHLSGATLDMNGATYVR
ncbi:MAG: SDR family oxidoreductase [Hyphomicrobiales bacterium]|nr:SDR family oxidoreductase [Hyphomicrobiales bacterium]